MDVLIRRDQRHAMKTKFLRLRTPAKIASLMGDGKSELAGAYT